MISVKNLTKSFSISSAQNYHNVLPVIKNISFELESGVWASLTGPSGSGKTTLLSLLAGLERPCAGSIQISKTEITSLNEDDLCDFRARTMGFIFQSFRLLPHLTALENVQVTADLIEKGESSDRALELLLKVGLENRIHHFPSQLSGGEQQRVAVARAFMIRPKILFADEPTGNLDLKSGRQVLDLIAELSSENRSNVVVVTHDTDVASLASRQFRLRDGVMVD